MGVQYASRNFTDPDIQETYNRYLEDVDELTEEDFISSQYPYSYKAQQFETLFYNFCNHNDGKTWSTPFLIDDPQLFVVRPQRVVSIVKRKEATIARKQIADPSVAR